MSEQGSLSLAVKYRPKSFDSVVGQRHVVEILRRAVLGGRVPQQLLFSGRSGLGKTTIARIVAAAMLCETPVDERERGDVCGVCPSCVDALTPGRTHPDLIEFDAASHGGKDEIREIASRSHVAPLRSSVKVYIIDEAHGLSNPGGQAFLKLLEEPPEHVVFMLCTTDPQKMLKTNRGRCVEFELLPPTPVELHGNLRRVCDGEGWAPSDRVLDAVLAVSDPDLGVRGTVSTLAKLGGVLDGGGDPGDEMVAQLLGSPPPKAMRRLLDHIEQMDRVAALTELASLRTVTSDVSIRAALLRWANERVRASLAGSPRSLDLAVWQLEQALSVPDGREWLDVLVARLANPDLDGPPEGVVAEARAVLAELREQVGAAAVASKAAVPAVDPVPSRSPAPAVAQLLAAAAPAPPGLAEVLALCDVRIDDTSVAVLVPSSATARIAPFNAALRTAASRLGLSLKFRRGA